jgi:hypothetical protein
VRHICKCNSHVTCEHEFEFENGKYTGDFNVQKGHPEGEEYIEYKYGDWYSGEWIHGSMKCGKYYMTMKDWS